MQQRELAVSVLAKSFKSLEEYVQDWISLLCFDKMVFLFEDVSCTHISKTKQFWLLVIVNQHILIGAVGEDIHADETFSQLECSNYT